MILSRLNELRFNRVLIGGLLVIFFVQCIAYNLALPLFEAPDEGAHYIYIDYIASHGQLPDLEHMLSHEVSQTPLYYMIGAPMIAWIDRSDFGEVFRIEPGLNNGIVNAHSSKERAFPANWRDAGNAHLAPVFHSAWRVHRIAGLCHRKDPL